MTSRAAAGHRGIDRDRPAKATRPRSSTCWSATAAACGRWWPSGSTRRLAARVDPSDVVQEVLAEAIQHFAEYLRTRPLPFSAWLRQFAWQRLVKLHRHHIRAQKRSVRREEGLSMPLPDDSVVRLARRLLARGSSPSQALIHDELRKRSASRPRRVGPA